MAAEPVREGLLRVYNLLSTHAIVHVTDAFKQASMEAIVHSIADRAWEHDKAMAALQERFNVYAMTRPMFYQAAALQKPHIGQRQEDATNIVITPTAIGVPGTLELRQGPRACLLLREDGKLKWRWSDGSDEKIS